MEKTTDFVFPNAIDNGSPKQSFWVGVPNPFYIISAALFVHGTVLPADGGLSPQTQVLLSLAYIVLCAGTSVWLVRRLKRWDDARSLVVIVAGMFLAVSLELDDGLAQQSFAARWFITGSVFAVAIATFEWIRRGCQLGLPKSFVAAFYTQWAIILLYPAAMSNDVLIARWQIACFALLAASGWLLYWPALGRSKPGNAVGWSYPMCPWLLPIITGGASLLRLYFLTVSFDPVPSVFYQSGSWNWTTVLGYDFAVPFMLSLSLLLAESGRRAKRKERQRWASVLAAASVLTAVCPAPNGVAAAFRAEMAAWFDLPTTQVVAAVAVLTFLWLRRIELSRIAWLMAIVGGGLLLPSTKGAWSKDVALVLLGITTAISLIYGYRTRSLAFVGLGVVGVYVALFRHLPAGWTVAPYRGPEIAAVVLFAIAAFRFRGRDQKILASLTGLAWVVMLFPLIRGVFQERMPLESLLVVGLWTIAAIPFVMRFGTQPIVIGSFALVLLGVFVDLLLRLIVDPKSGRVLFQMATLAGAAIMFVCGLLLSREKTRREITSSSSRITSG